ncbi:hypothetical protein [Rubripirellula obstinata]|uniref:hypothetical protein n=1 Tax=Rubripirellula obstinata TaxID=406547 RepID=UPI00122C51AC|nr:hypothetical protein [Rubripirellula obstinata]
MSNVEEENDQFTHWRETVAGANPDILVVLETDERWVQAAKPVHPRLKTERRVPRDLARGLRGS